MTDGVHNKDRELRNKDHELRNKDRQVRKLLQEKGRLGNQIWQDNANR